MNEDDRHVLHKKGSPNHSQSLYRYEDILQDCIRELQRIESNLRIKGDFWRADRVKRFRIEYFGEEEVEAK